MSTPAPWPLSWDNPEVWSLLTLGVPPKGTEVHSSYWFEGTGLFASSPSLSHLRPLSWRVSRDRLPNKPLVLECFSQVCLSENPD